MKNSKPTFTEKQLKTVAEILIRLMFVESLEELHTVCEEIFVDYKLFKDPFTHLPCTPNEYAKNSLEYERQTMLEKYGHYDGLE